MVRTRTRARCCGSSRSTTPPSSTPSEPINPGQSVRLVLVLQQRSSWRPEDLRLELYGFRFVEDDPGTLDPNRWDSSDPFLVAAGPVDAEVEP